MPRDWRELINSDGFSDTQRLVHLAMRLDSVDQESIRGQLVKARRREYETTITDMARSVGCDKQSIVREGEILNELNELSANDAQSMVNTYNYDLAVAIIAIRTELPTANRNTYAARLRTWDANRSEWKNKQVAVNTVLTARSLAQRDFMRFNDIGGQAQLRGPAPAAEPICQGWLNRGLVDVQVAIDNPSPYHLNCLHVWEMELDQLDRGRCRDLWTG